MLKYPLVIITWIYPVVIITWIHYDFGGGADVAGVPSGHYYLGLSQFDWSPASWLGTSVNLTGISVNLTGVSVEGGVAVAVVVVVVVVVVAVAN